MKAILLAAGFGTRLRPITNTIPKCLVPIKGIPLLQIWIELLLKAGLNDIIINTHYLSSQVEKFLNHSPYKNNCILRNEKELLGTAGTLIANLNYIGEDECLLIHADNYCLADFTEFINVHNQRPENCLMSMMTFRTDNPSSCGIVELDEKNIVIGFHEKIDFPPGNLANGAIYILSAEMLKIINEKFSRVTDFSNEILHHFLGRIYNYETKGKFVDIGTVVNYNKFKNG